MTINHLPPAIPAVMACPLCGGTGRQVEYITHHRTGSALPVSAGHCPACNGRGQVRVSRHRGQKYEKLAWAPEPGKE